jgi:hypothetical protein
VLVLNAQAGAAQLWRRNGFSLVNQIHNYSSNLCRTVSVREEEKWGTVKNKIIYFEK